MLRSTLSAVAIAATLLVSPLSPPAAHAQPFTVQEFNQTLLDRWLTVFPSVTGLAAWATAPPSEKEGMAHMERICADAGFESYDQCASTIGYAGMLFSGFDPRTSTFQNPVTMMRTHIARIDSDKQMTDEAKEKMTAPMKQVIASFPPELPDAHLRLMTTNRDRIFAVMKAARKK